MAAEVDFPLLPGCQDTFQDRTVRYPRFFTFADGSSAPLFTRGIVSLHSLERIAQSTAEHIVKRYVGQRLLVVQVLEGARAFARMVTPHLDRLCPVSGIDYELGAVQVRSYSHGSQATKHHILSPLQDSQGAQLPDCSAFEGVVLVDDLVDGGDTMAWLITEYLPRFAAKSVGFCTMLDKDRPRTQDVDDTLSAFLISAGQKVPNDWLVGYGLDMALPGCGETSTLHLFRQPLPGGVYAFNSDIEERLVREYQQRPAWVAEQLSPYRSQE